MQGEDIFQTGVDERTFEWTTGRLSIGGSSINGEQYVRPISMVLVTLENLFEEPFNTGYPEESAERKKRDAKLFKAIKSFSHHGIVQILSQLDRAVINPVLQKQDLVEFLLWNGTNTDISNYLIEQTKYLNSGR
ncbi:hypothetical protein ACIQXF_02955 [Lysinibacillus sp. NPDC097231]|uniref:hypothetical protein n=1 Tax=Lysinibacillus sp. NPDC097231 TaxID=3364142 RepID=UPI003821CC66